MQSTPSAGGVTFNTNTRISSTLCLVAPLLLVFFLIFVYTILPAVFNTTQIRITRDVLVVSHGPWPPIGQKRRQQIAIRDIMQVFVESNQAAHTLKALLRDGKRITIILNSLMLKDLRYIEAQIEARLGIVDARVQPDKNTKQPIVDLATKDTKADRVPGNLNSQLFDGVSASFSMGELETLCVSLGVDFDRLADGSKDDKIMDLLTQLNQGSRTADLLAYCRATRPNYSWPMAT